MVDTCWWWTALPAAVMYPLLDKSSPDRLGKEAPGLSRNSDKLGILKSDGFKLSKFKLVKLSN